MSQRPRILVVSRRYWPICTDATWRLLHWTDWLTKRECEVTVVSARWHHTWSSRIVCRETPVQRIEQAPTNPLRSARYSRTLVEWVSNRASQFDLIYCDAAELEAQALLTQLETADRSRIVVRFDPWELMEAGEPQWHPSQRTLEACRKARFLIAPRVDAVQKLKAIGVDDQRIVRLPDVPPCILSRTDLLRSAARHALADCNHELYVRSTDRLIVCPGELTQRWGVDLLIRALGPMLNEHRSLRLWILGDSSERSRIYEQLRYQGWHNLVSMPGAFEDVEEVLRAADLCIFPARGRGQSWLLPTCLKSGIPVLAASGAELRNWWSPELDGQLSFREADHASLRQRVAEWLDDSRPVKQAVEVARQQLTSENEAPGWDRFLSRVLQATE